MLASLQLSGFRGCVDATPLALGRLSVLAGANNTGKSSFIGALLALVQSQQAAARHRLLLKGEWVDLGPFDEVLSPDRATFSIAVEGRTPKGELSIVWDFDEVPRRRDRPEARVTRIEATLGDETLECELDPGGRVIQRSDAGLQLLDPTCLLSVDRSEPVRLFPYDFEQVLAVGPYRAPPRALSEFRVGRDGSLVGFYGQYAAEAFSQRRNDTTDILPPDAGVAKDTITHAMNAWWSHILADEIVVTVQEVARLGYSVRLDTSAIASRSFSQVGFGLSQLWPILVACLVSRPGDLVLIETPEAHLHPAAQHRIAALFVELARLGRQVIVETHSEHVVAAACLAVKRGALASEDVALSFFAHATGHTRIERIEVDASGRRLRAPEGFFDQTAVELIELLR
ncbi:MAG: DUF3696 domain-containing protein [Polyangiaceae bacterium]